jgi:hypothetical protein
MLIIRISIGDGYDTIKNLDVHRLNNWHLNHEDFKEPVNLYCSYASSLIKQFLNHIEFLNLQFLGNMHLRQLKIDINRRWL